MSKDEEIAMYKNMVKLYKFDFLTGLKTRYDFITETKHKMQSQMFYLMMTDITGLHAVNRDPKKGYEFGDMLIKKVANDLKSIKYQWETYRLGGDEFMTILFEKPDIEIDNATSACVFSGNFLTLEEAIKAVDTLVTKKKILLDRRRK